MGDGELLTKVTIWVAFIGYAAGTVAFALSTCGGRGWDRAARLSWTVACAALLAHAACAFHFRRRPRALVAAWLGFLIFIIFNATVVF